MYIKQSSTQFEFCLSVTCRIFFLVVPVYSRYQGMFQNFIFQGLTQKFREEISLV